MRLWRYLAAVTACGGLLAAAPPPANAQDKQVDLKFAFWVPANHPLAKLGNEPWAKSVEAASKGSIKVSLFPAQQLGKAPDHYDMARDGIAELTWVNPGYQAGRFPVFAAGELPFLMSDQGGGSAALDAWYRKYAAKEMSDVHFCFAHLHIGTLHSKIPITDPGQIKGMKIRPANATIARFVTLLGGTNVQASAPEARDVLEKGVAEAITFPWGSIVLFGIDKVTKYHIDSAFYVTEQLWVINKGKYDALSAAQRKVIDDHCSPEWALKIAAPWAEFEAAGRDKIKAQGHEVYPLTPAQLAEWRKAAEPLQAEWAANVKKAGYDPDVLLKELKDSLTKYKSLY